MKAPSYPRKSHARAKKRQGARLVENDNKLLMTGQESIQCVRDTNSIYANFTIDVLIIDIKKVVLRVVAGLFH